MRLRHMHPQTAQQPQCIRQTGQRVKSMQESADHALGLEHSAAPARLTEQLRNDGVHVHACFVQGLYMVLLLPGSGMPVHSAYVSSGLSF